LSGFEKLFWGFLFLLDFRLQGFDILPDAIGYFLFYSGLEDLMAQNSLFARARMYALPLMALSLFDIYQASKPASGINLSIESWPFMIIGLAMAVLNLMIVYHLCTGVAKMARAKGLVSLRTTAETRWRYYLGANLALLIITPLVLLVPLLSLVLIMPVFIIMIVVIILMMALMKQAGQEL